MYINREAHIIIILVKHHAEFDLPCKERLHILYSTGLLCFLIKADIISELASKHST